MSDRPLVSIIIPAYNAAAFITETVSSALNQTWSEKEIIIVDDGSEDDTIEIVERMQQPALRLIRQENEGAAGARNVGLNAAAGAYIQFLDADDVMSPTKIEAQLRGLQFATPRSVASCAWAHFETDLAHAEYEPEPVWTIEDPIEWLVRSLSGEGMMQPAAWLTPRSVIDDAGLWNESLSLHDDGEFFTRVLLNADRNVFVPDATVYYRTVPESLSRQRSRQAIESAFEVCLARHRLLLAARNDELSRKAIATQYAQFAYEFRSAAPDLAQDALTAIAELEAEPANVVGGPAFRILAGAIGFERSLRVRAWRP